MTRKIVFSVIIVLQALILLAFAKDTDLTNQDALAGPYEVDLVTFDIHPSNSADEHMDKISVWYPTFSLNNTSNRKFPFISYAHGMFGGGALEIPGYNMLLKTMTSFGYIIAATHQCSVGCFDDCNSLEHDPPCFGNYYKKQLGVFDFAKEFKGDSSGFNPFNLIDWSKGVGIAGHSMGGQATLFSSSYNNATTYNIKAAVLHHAFTHSFPAPSIPFLVFTGENDVEAPADTMGVPIFEAGAGLPRGLVDKTLAGHHEPDITSLDRNGISLLAQFSVAWFKLYLDETPYANGFDYDAMIYGQGAQGVCSGGDGNMTTCTIERGTQIL